MFLNCYKLQSTHISQFLKKRDFLIGQIFRHLDQLEAGDEIVLYTSQRAYVYVVVKTMEVEPTEVSVMENSADATTTLISCYPYLIDDQRIVVKARLKAVGGS